MVTICYEGVYPEQSEGLSITKKMSFRTIMVISLVRALITIHPMTHSHRMNGIDSLAFWTFIGVNRK